MDKLKNLNMKFPRSSGILLPLSSLPSNFGIGDLGPNAYRFIDWLKEANQHLWQILPFSITDSHGCPYSSISAYGANPYLVSLEKLVEIELLQSNDLIDARQIFGTQVHYEEVEEYKRVLFYKAFEKANREKIFETEFYKFCKSEAHWLDDLALFTVITEQLGNDWVQWPNEIKYRSPETLEKFRRLNEEQIDFYKFLQFLFFMQWAQLKKYANTQGIKLIGDIPIFLSHHSMDVWRNPELFKLDDYGMPYVVTGAPPDQFSTTGQKWGNPNYNWWRMEQDGFLWWRNRMSYNLRFYDIIRLDHFRGFAATWEIDRDNPDARSGCWSWVPGDNLFHCFKHFLGDIPLIVEDLGKITDDVKHLREKYHLPGMKILQLAFDEGNKSEHLPHNYPENCVVYTGTHDNNTTKGWFSNLGSTLEAFYAVDYSKAWNWDNMNWSLIHLAAHSKAVMAIYPLQDILGLGSEARINTPGTLDGNWAWRFNWSQLRPEDTLHLADITKSSHRNFIAKKHGH